MSTDKNILVITSELFHSKRTELGLSQEKMAEHLRISRRQYQYIEYGERPPSLEAYSNFASLCDVDVQSVMSDISKISQKAKE